LKAISVYINKTWRVHNTRDSKGRFRGGHHYHF